MAVTILAGGILSFKSPDGTSYVIRTGSQGQLLCHRTVCPHRGGPLNLGSLWRDEYVVCPWHGTRWRIPRCGSRSLPYVLAVRPGATVIVGKDSVMPLRVLRLREDS